MSSHVGHTWQSLYGMYVNKCDQIALFYKYNTLNFLLFLAVSGLSWSLFPHRIPLLPPLVCLASWAPCRISVRCSVRCQTVVEHTGAGTKVSPNPSPHSYQGSTNEVEPAPSVVDPPVPPMSLTPSVMASALSPMPSCHAADSAWWDVAVNCGRPSSSSCGH